MKRTAPHGWIVILTMVLLGFGLYACAPEGGSSTSGDGSTMIAKPAMPPVDEDVNPPDGAFNIPLCAGQDMWVGNVYVWIEDDPSNGYFLYVQYLMDDPYLLYSTRLHVADDPADFPTTGSGNPQIGHFKYGSTHPDGATKVTFKIPLDEKTSECDLIYIAAHADVSFGETAWGGACEPCGCDPRGRDFFGGSWASYFVFCVPALPGIDGDTPAAFKMGSLEGCVE